jgi:hypothetical protein
MFGLRRIAHAVAACALLVAGCANAGTATHAPHPALAGLRAGEALDLGAYTCEARAPAQRCERIFDYSRINHDPQGHRMLAFGGGHAASGRTDVDVFDLNTLRWSSLYPSMSCEEVAANDTDPLGFHRRTRHPVARHTYDQTVVADLAAGGRWLILFSTEGFKGVCHPYNARIGGVASLRLDREPPTWSYADPGSMPWGYSGVAEFDPKSGMVILIGGQHDGLWVYDPRTHTIVARLPHIRRPSASSNLVYHPPSDRMVLVDRESGAVRTFELARGRWDETREHRPPIEGAPPPKMRNLAYDARHQVLGGIVDNVFHALDLGRLAWQAHPIRTASPGRTPGTVRHHAIDYDPVNNVFIFVSGEGRTLRTWAYRFKP